MTDEAANKCSVLFRIHNGGGIYSIPVEYVTWIESLDGKPVSVPHFPNHVVGVYHLHGKSVSIVDLGHLLGFEHLSNLESSNRNLLIIENTQLGFLVETVLGVEVLHSSQNAGPSSKELVHRVYSFDSGAEIIFELDVPHLLSLCSYLSKLGK